MQLKNNRLNSDKNLTTRRVHLTIMFIVSDDIWVFDIDEKNTPIRCLWI